MSDDYNRSPLARAVLDNELHEARKSFSGALADLEAAYSAATRTSPFVTACLHDLTKQARAIESDLTRTIVDFRAEHGIND